MAIALTKFDTQVILNSTTPGDKVVTIPGSSAANNGFSLDIKTTVGDGSTIIIRPETGSIEGLPCIQFTDNHCNISLRSNGIKTNWLVRQFSCFQGTLCGA